MFIVRSVCGKISLLLGLVLLLGLSARAGEIIRPEIEIRSDIAYKSGETLSEYELQRCQLDVYLPAGKPGFATVVWFHGGGLKEGSKTFEFTPKIARSLVASGVAVVVPNYRLSPKATYPAYVEDAAAAFAWTRSHIAQFGGDTNKLFVSGHSAGGYLALMIGMDARYLRAHGLALDSIAGLIPVSGQTMTHYTIREERGIGKFTITADEAAPVYHCRKDTPPMLVLYADRDMAARAEENMYLVAILKGASNQCVTGKLIADRTHGSIASRMAQPDDPGKAALLEFMAVQSRLREKAGEAKP